MKQKKTKILISTKNKDKILEHISRCSISEESKAAIMNCEFQRIEYCPEYREMSINLRSAEITSSSDFLPVKSYFKKMLPGLDSVIFDISFDRPVTADIVVSKLWEDVTAHIIKLSPSCQVWLPISTPSLLNDSSIRLEIGDETGFYTLKDRAVDKNIEKYLLDKYNLTCRVFIDKSSYKADKIGGFEYKDPVEPSSGNGSSGRQETGSINAGGGSAPRAFAPAANGGAQPQSGGASQQPVKPNIPAAENNVPKPAPAQPVPSAPADDSVIHGKKIKENAVPSKISTLFEAEKNVTIEGIVVSAEDRITKSGKVMTSFSVCDLTDTIVCKLFSEAGKSPKLKAGMVVRAFGSIKFDEYAKDMIMMVNDINKGKLKKREDKSERKRVELHAHSKMSALDGMTEISDFVKLAAYWKHKAVALTDHGVVQGFPDFYDAAKSNNIKPIFGMEGYLIDDSYAGLVKGDKLKVKPPAPYHIIILAVNYTGLKNLYKLVSASHIDYFYKKPRIPRTKLLELREGLILGTACEAGELIRGIVEGKTEEEIDAIVRYYDYLEIQPVKNNNFMIEKFSDKFSSVDDLKALNKKIYELGKKHGKPVCATSDMHYLNPEDAIYRKILFAGQKYEDVENSCELYFPTTDEMLEEFSYLGEDAAREVVIDNPEKISESIESLAPIPRENAFPVMEGAEEKIREMSYANAEAIYASPLPETVQKRLDYELNCIIKNGFATLYLIAHELVKKSLDDGYLVGSRGSVGSSLVATFTNITEVNPLPPHYICIKPECRYSEFFEDSTLNSGYDLPDKNCPKCGAKLKKDGHKIPFEVFLGFEGDKTPDIDLNFSGEYQPAIHKYVEVIFGENNVFRAGTISTIADKTAFGFVKTYLEERKLTKRMAEMNRLSIGCSGVKRTTGQHPGGIMIIPKGRDVHEFTPINYPANDRSGGTITTHFDYNAIDKKLLKLDLLGHDDPTFIKMLQDLTGVNVYEIPFDDKKTLSLFSGLDALGISPEDINGIKLGTLGIPEFGTSFVRGMLEETLPTTFGELVRISGLSHGTDVWLNNAQSYIKSGDAKLSEVISVRDDIINYLIEHKMPNKASFDIMENVRKGKGLKGDMAETMKQHNIPQWYIDSCNKIKYMFPKAHAAAYVMMAFRIAYFKVNYPQAFYSTYFSTKGLSSFDAAIVLKGREYILSTMSGVLAKGKEATAKDFDLYTVLEIVLEALARGIKFHPVDIYQSHYEKFTPKDKDGLICPFSSVQGLGNVAARRIFEEAQKGPFISVEDFKDRAGVSKSVIEALDAIGSLKSLPKTDQLCFFE